MRATKCKIQACVTSRTTTKIKQTQENEREKICSFCCKSNMLMFCDDDGLVVIVVSTLVWIIERYAKMIGYVS